MKPHVAQVVKLVAMSISFLLVFLAFNGTQTIMSSLLSGRLGYWSIACIYIAFTISSLFLSSAFVIAVSIKWSLFIGGVLYLGFIVANIFPSWETLVPFAVVLGIGASIIWAAEGAYVTNAAVSYAQLTQRPERSSLGLFNGIFFGIFQLSMFIGNIISSLVLSSSSDDNSDSSLSYSSGEKTHRAKLLFYIYTSICSIGVFGLLLLPSPESNDDSDEDEGNKKRKPKTVKKKEFKNPLEKIIGALILWKEPRMLLMIAYLLFTGFEQAFIFGDFTKQFVRELHGVHNVGFVMSVFGAVDSICSFIFGRVADRIGARWIGYSGAILMSVFLVTIRFCRDSTFGETLAAAFMWSALLGVADACIFSVFCNAAMAILFSDRAEAAFSNVKVFQAGGTAIMFFLAPYLTFNTKIYIMSGTLLVAVICILILDLRVSPLRPQKIKDPSKNVPTDSVSDIQTSESSERMPLIKVDHMAEDSSV